LNKIQDYSVFGLCVLKNWTFRKLDLFLKIDIFWDMTPCNLFKFNRRFGGTYSPYFQGRRISGARNQRESRWQILISSPEYSHTLKIGRYVSPKRLLISCGLHGVTSQKIVLFMATAVRTSNSTTICYRPKVSWRETPSLLVSLETTNFHLNELSPRIQCHWRARRDSVCHDLWLICCAERTREYCPRYEAVGEVAAAVRRKEGNSGWLRNWLRSARV
jgi:hypothetical protein